ncbi:MAG TPA: hypothetical protein PLN05_11445 [Pyrinomonadaceae bacterium]|nr:hypothetical protein [Pyrinomonadaceae bacterium]HRK51035.1 hypothetical protein [Pyrinomonadaceae bacterium]
MSKPIYRSSIGQMKIFCNSAVEMQVPPFGAAYRGSASTWRIG